MTAPSPALSETEDWGLLGVDDIQDPTFLDHPDTTGGNEDYTAPEYNSGQSNVALTSIVDATSGSVPPRLPDREVARSRRQREVARERPLDEEVSSRASTRASASTTDTTGQLEFDRDKCKQQYRAIDWETSKRFCLACFSKSKQWPCPHIRVMNELGLTPDSNYHFEGDRAAADQELRQAGIKLEDHPRAQIWRFWTCKARDGSTDLWAADLDKLEAEFNKSSK